MFNVYSSFVLLHCGKASAAMLLYIYIYIYIRNATLSYVVRYAFALKQCNSNFPYSL